MKHKSSSHFKGAMTEMWEDKAVIFYLFHSFYIKEFHNSIQKYIRNVQI